MFSNIVRRSTYHESSLFTGFMRTLSQKSRMQEITMVCDKKLDLSENLPVHSIWLRHHCQCEKCFNPKTFQRVQIPSHLPNVSSVADSTIDPKSNQLLVSWEDGHSSKFDLTWLRNNMPKLTATAEPNTLKSHYNENNFVHVQSTSTSTAIQPEKFAVRYKDFMKEGNDGVAHLLSNIHRYGYGFVSECPPDFETTKKVTQKVSHLQNTLYGDFFEWTSNLAHADTAYTSDVVHLHTDTSYFTEPAGLQIFHCLKHDGAGGMNSLVDGFQIAKQIAIEHPEFYKVLTKTFVPGQYVDLGEHHFLSNDVTFGHDVITGQIQKMRYNPHDMAVLKNLPFEDVSIFYESLIHLSDRLEEKPQTLRFTPGLVIFLDNWRVLHGREAYTGFRHMCGTYISRSDWLSKARTLGVLTSEK